MVLDCFSASPSIYLDEIQQELCDETGTWVSKSTICREAKSMAGTYLKINEENSNSLLELTLWFNWKLEYECIHLYGLMKLAQTSGMLLESMLTACEVLHPSTTASILQVDKFMLFQPEGLKMFTLQKEVSIMVICSVISLRSACYLFPSMGLTPLLSLTVLQSITSTKSYMYNWSMVLVPCCGSFTVQSGLKSYRTSCCLSKLLHPLPQLLNLLLRRTISGSPPKSNKVLEAAKLV